MKTALITGVSGQDGSLLAELLLSKNYHVVAVSNHELSAENEKSRNYMNFISEITWKAIQLEDHVALNDFISKNVPDEVYHLGAKSFPSIGFQSNFPAFQANAEGTYNLLSGTYTANPDAKFFFAGSAEIFGDNPHGLMNEEEKFFPKTMYGISKLVGYELVRNYRDTMGKYAVTGILFNHESPRRGEEFVTRKITLAAAKIKLGLQDKLILGSLDSERDWSAAEDFVEGFHLALHAPKAKDYIFGSGQLHTIREFVSLAFTTLGLKYEDYVEIDPAFNRPSKNNLIGNSLRARSELGWAPKHSFESIVERMVKSDYDALKGT